MLTARFLPAGFRVAQRGQRHEAARVSIERLELMAFLPIATFGGAVSPEGADLRLCKSVVSRMKILS